MIINITPTGVIESTLMYGIVHGVWLLIKKLTKSAYKEIRAERNRIIKHHVKSGHKGHPLHCIDQVCFSLRTPVPAQAEPGQVLHTDL